MRSNARVRIVTGKGGVGKTVVATAIAKAEASAGRRVLLAETNGGDRITALLGAEPTKGELREVLENIFVVDMRPDLAIREYALMTLRFETVYKAVFGNRLVRSFLNLVPSLGELTLLGKLWYHEQEIENGRPRFDTLIVDAPSTGHAISMLRAPRAVAETVPAGPMRDNCQRIDDLLTDQEKTRMHIVTTPEEMPVNEAVRLEQHANDTLGIRLGTTIVNFWVDRLPSGVLDDLAPLANEPAHAKALAALTIRDEKSRVGEAHLDRLPAHMRADCIHLPRLNDETFNMQSIDQLAACLRPAETH